MKVVSSNQGTLTCPLKDGNAHPFLAMIQCSSSAASTFGLGFAW